MVLINRLTFVNHIVAPLNVVSESAPLRSLGDVYSKQHLNGCEGHLPFEFGDPLVLEKPGNPAQRLVAGSLSEQSS